VRLGGEPWVDFLIFRGFVYYLVFWFYFMKVYLMRCQPFNGRHKTHVFCKDRTVAALLERILLHKVGDGNPITRLKNLCFSHVKDTSLECKSSYNSVCRIFLFVISHNTQKISLQTDTKIELDMQ
jgi:hypothetical protein